ncbi:hypothetical protein DPMN_121120 [Dreissena polymorpha]|uniref:Uncharacterized protein n=1 Tax=Dreissena polymorpha TaxID=45954 RepID=A0A9D4GM68_DREPO|nr:hypothetical protein DPMN_121120 [Dreissena polymorpha]
MSTKSRNVKNPETETETNRNDDNDFGFNNSSTAKEEAHIKFLMPERETGESNKYAKPVFTANEANKEQVETEAISTAEPEIGDQEQATIFSEIQDMCCDTEVVRNHENLHKEEEQDSDTISNTKATSKEALEITDNKQDDAMTPSKLASFKHGMYIDRMKATIGKDMNVIRKVQLTKNNSVFSSNMFGSRENDALSVTETCSSQTNEDNAVKTPRSPLETFKVVHANKCGGIEHMRQIRIENNIRMKWMKIITARRRIADSIGGMGALDHLKKFDTNVIRNVQLSRQGDDYSSNMINPKTFPCHTFALTNGKDEFVNGMHAFTLGDLAALSENAISRYKVNRSPINRSMSDGQPTHCTQDKQAQQEEASRSLDIRNVVYVIKENSNDFTVFEGDKLDIAQERMPFGQYHDDELNAIDDIVQTTASDPCKDTANTQNKHTNEKVDAIRIIPAKKYGSLEHMKKIKMENAVKIRRLKNITASDAVTRSVAPKAGRSDVTLPEQTKQSRHDDESGYEKKTADSHNCRPTSLKPYDAIGVYDEHVSGNDDCATVSSNPRSNDIADAQITAAKVTKVSVNLTANSSFEPPLKHQRPQSKVNMDPPNIIPAKKYGGLEQLKKIKMGNAIKLQRLKSEQASSHVQRPLSTSSRGVSHIHTSGMQDYDKTNETNDSPKGGTLIGQRLQTWHTPDKEFSYSEKEVDEKPIPYGSVAHFMKIKRDNAARLRHLKGIHKRVDTWKSVDRSCSDLDPGKEKEYGSVAHFKMVQMKNAARNRKMNAITSKLHTWKEQNPGSEYSMDRQNNWGAVKDPRKFGSVAHFQQAKQQNASRTSCLKQATSKLNTWQPKSKMERLSATGHMSMSRHIGQMESLKMSVRKATSKIDTGLVKVSQSAGGQVASWSRHLKDVRSPKPNTMNITTTAANQKFSNATTSFTKFNHRRESNQTKAALASQRSDKSLVTSKQRQILPAQYVGNDGIALSAREYECIEHRLRHPDSRIRFPCTETEVDARLKELLKLLRVSIFAKTSRPLTCDGSDGDSGFYVSPCDSFLADEAAMELEYEMEQRALIAGNDLVNFVPRPRPTINKHGHPPTKIPRPVFNVLEKIMQSRFTSCEVSLADIMAPHQSIGMQRNIWSYTGQDRMTPQQSTLFGYVIRPIFARRILN